MASPEDEGEREGMKKQPDKRKMKMRTRESKWGKVERN